MTENCVVVDAPPDAVYAVLADAGRYADWVVGAKRIRHADPDWPAPGTRFGHTVGAGPVATSDETEVLAARPERTVVLHAKVRPLMTARVALDLEPVDDGERTRVRMVEDVVSGPARHLGRVLDPIIHVRNAASLRRLAEIVEKAA